MSVELKDFQTLAVEALLREIRSARRDILDYGKPQAIILSSPTGSGKTVTVTALMEAIVRGDETHVADPEAVFLWLSDSPELNTQSRDKIVAQSSIFRDHELVVVEHPFSREQFEAGKVFFLNTQKLGKDSLLTKAGDGREFTIWQTIENTAQSKPEHFYLVIDEAHRGMNLTDRQRQQAQSIVQKFIRGDETVGLSPVKLVIGISATPERFNQFLDGLPREQSRTKRPYDVPPGAVRESGLLKDKIVLFCPEETQPSDWTLLWEAVKRWRRVCNDWRKYSREQGIPPVDPVLVVQVEDRTESSITRTDLTKAVEILEREARGQFGIGALAHCFETEQSEVAGGHQIRKIEASKIQQDTVARVVFFKTALTTGWDCPRAEVMMSFRKARDHTAIAQLVGRMVRTPLARRIEGSELLNTVSLYLPHYDREGLRTIVEKLNDPENAPATEIVEGSQLVTLTRDPEHQALFLILAGLPSYAVERIPKTSNTRRLVKLARQLTLDEVSLDAWTKAKALVIGTLKNELARLRQDASFARFCRETQAIEVREVHVEAGEWKEIIGGKVTKVKATPENVDDLFDICGRMLGEGLHKEFWKDQWDRQDSQRSKLELFGILQERDAWRALEAVTHGQIEALFNEHKDDIAKLPTSKREEYNRIRRRAKDPQTVSLMFPETFDVPREDKSWKHHLYVAEDGRFRWDANTWEAAVLKEEMGREGFVAWFRNFPRKPWSLCVPYRHRGEDTPLYPDILVFRRSKGRLHVDLLDPHDNGRADAVDKAVGLARFADKHGDFFGRIELIVLDGRGEIKRLDVNRDATRKKVMAVRETGHLQSLFDEQG